MTLYRNIFSRIDLFVYSLVSLLSVFITSFTVAGTFRVRYVHCTLDFRLQQTQVFFTQFVVNSIFLEN